MRSTFRSRDASTPPQFEVELDETFGEANGVAYLVHMLLSQKAEASESEEFARQARRLKPVSITLSDTGETGYVLPCKSGLRVTSDFRGVPDVHITALSKHIPSVSKLRLAGRLLITGPFGSDDFRSVGAAIVSRRIVIKGLVTHYLTALRFLWLINMRQS